MKTVRFYNMMIDCVENGINTVRELGAESHLTSLIVWCRIESKEKRLCHTMMIVII